MSRTKILVLVDNTDPSMVALRFACSQAKSLSAPIEMLTVVQKDEIQSVLAPSAPQNEEVLERESMLDRYAKIVTDSTGTSPSLLLHEGSLIEAVTHAIDQDSSIGALVVGYDQSKDCRSHTALSLLSKLGESLAVPITIVPGNLTHQQIDMLFPSDDQGSDVP